MDGLLAYCRTERQREVIQAWLDNGAPEKGAGTRAVAELGITERRFREIVSGVRKRAAAAGWDPDSNSNNNVTHVVRDGFQIKGESTLLDSDGEQLVRWVKTEKDNEARLEAMLEAMADAVEAFAGIAKPVKLKSKKLTKDAMAVYPMGDPHIGMYAWQAETLEDYDCDIAQRDLLSSVARLVHRAPSTETALLCNLGDFFHVDNSLNTTTYGTPMDADGRWVKVLQTGLATAEAMVIRALEKHQHVMVENAIGNHDQDTSMFLSLFLDAVFRDDPRVTVNLSPKTFRYYRFGQNLLGVTHGDKIKVADLPQIMAADRPEDWGETRYRHWLIGHVHHKQGHELHGTKVESFRTLAAQDKWHHRQGYRAGRDMHCIVYHRDYGELERYRVDIALARAEEGE